MFSQPNDREEHFCGREELVGGGGQRDRRGVANPPEPGPTKKEWGNRKKFVWSPTVGC